MHFAAVAELIAKGGRKLESNVCAHGLGGVIMLRTNDTKVDES